MPTARSPLALAALAAALAGCARSRAATTPVPAPAGQPPAGQPAAAGQPASAAAAGTPAGRPSLAGALSTPNADPFPSTYQPVTTRPTVIRNVVLLTATGPAIRNGAILLRDGKIAAVGQTVDAPADALVVDGGGRYVTPGIVDTHSHLGVYPAPGVQALSDGNEATNPVTAHVWAEHSVWPQDPQFPRNLAGGVTTLQVLPGSANLIGGRSAVLKVVPSRTVQGMKFPGARYGLKMACGENPKRVYASRGPSTRMGNVAGYRAAWIQAEGYRRRWDAWLGGNRQADPPTRDLGLETLAEVLRGNIFVHNHCYRADEMAQMVDVAREFGYRIRSFHHGVEAYKIADLMARDSISGSVWSDWGGFKLEALDGVKANLPMLHRAGVRAITHSDDPSGSQRLLQESAKAMAAGRQIGIDVPEHEAIRWVTLNAAWALGLDDRIGSLEVGKNADVVLWSGNPFSVYTRADRVWIDGHLYYDRSDPREQWRTDFELGFVPAPAAGGTR
ncbi:amidohydrolase [Roseisolibacter sp. H3M3-2]|uniref:amidohydrolase n=1 Tax=Roseisolibacter sp. H3M3-2 TaxID=3031323 RepID=UPI0023DC0153|nr:amidohydrolase [Roseisolibacter sp. H3M3-2]MDF1503526.1 amidohydrolase [Roseisolibacter sp. H3M3-2]